MYFFILDEIYLLLHWEVKLWIFKSTHPEKLEVSL